MMVERMDAQEALFYGFSMERHVGDLGGSYMSEID